MANQTDDIAEFDFDEDGFWLAEPPAAWDRDRRAEVVSLLNLLWDAANQFDQKECVTELRAEVKAGAVRACRWSSVRRTSDSADCRIDHIATSAQTLVAASDRLGTV